LVPRLVSFSLVPLDGYFDGGGYIEKLGAGMPNVSLNFLPLERFY
jgi:hypothetical protein